MQEAGMGLAVKRTGLPVKRTGLPVKRKYCIKTSLCLCRAQPKKSGRLKEEPARPRPLCRVNRKLIVFFIIRYRADKGSLTLDKGFVLYY